MSQFQNGIEDFDDQWLMAANYKEESINASLTVNEHDVCFQLDSASNHLSKSCKETPGVPNNSTFEYVEQN